MNESFNMSHISRDFSESKMEQSISEKSLLSHQSKVQKLDLVKGLSDSKYSSPHICLEHRSSTLHKDVSAQKITVMAKRDIPPLPSTIGILPGDLDKKSTFRSKLTSSYSMSTRYLYNDPDHDGIIMINKPMLDKYMKKLNQALVISTSTTKYQAWKVVKITIIFISCIHYIEHVAFFKTETEDQVRFLSKMHTLYQLFFIVDMVGSFSTEYHYQGSTAIERNFLKLVLLYFRKRFFVDLLSLLPFDRILSSILS